MRTLLMVVATLLILSGAVWILQGVGFLPGSFMTGQMEWAYAGIVTGALGGGPMWLALRNEHG